MNVTKNCIYCGCVHLDREDAGSVYHDGRHYFTAKYTCRNCKRTFALAKIYELTGCLAADDERDLMNKILQKG